MGETSESAPMDDEWIEEEHLILVELTGVLNHNYFAESDKECKILGIETENPVLQVGNFVFTGEYKKTLGTAVFFEQDKEKADTDAWKYKCCTDKKLEMKRVFIQSKENASAEPRQDTPTTTLDAGEAEAGT